MSVTSAYIECATGNWYHSIELADSFPLKYRHWIFANITASALLKRFERPASLHACIKDKIAPHQMHVLSTADIPVARSQPEGGELWFCIPSLLEQVWFLQQYYNSLLQLRVYRSTLHAVMSTQWLTYI